MRHWHRHAQQQCIVGHPTRRSPDRLHGPDQCRSNPQDFPAWRESGLWRPGTLVRSSWSMTTRHALTATLVLVAAASLAGCSDDDTGLTATEFRTEANAICTAGGEEVHGAFFSLGEDATAEDMQTAFDTVISVSYRQLDDIEDLAAPSELADQVDEFLRQGRADTDAAEAMGLGFFESEDDAWETTSELARGLGLDACAGG